MFDVDFCRSRLPVAKFELQDNLEFTGASREWKLSTGQLDGQKHGGGCLGTPGDWPKLGRVTTINWPFLGTSFSFLTAFALDTR